MKLEEQPNSRTKIAQDSGYHVKLRKVRNTHTLGAGRILFLARHGSVRFGSVQSGWVGSGLIRLGSVGWGSDRSSSVGFRRRLLKRRSH